MKIVEISLRRRVTVSMCAVALVLFGAVAFTRLPINLLPDVSYPTLTVETRFPGAAPAEVESLVSRPVEEAAGVVRIAIDALQIQVARHAPLAGLATELVAAQEVLVGRRVRRHVAPKHLLLVVRQRQ